MISSIYDPLGFLAPFTIPAKMILQDLCQLKCFWDDTIPPIFSTEWSFNPPAGFHHGGVWEHIIRMVRKILNTILRQQCLDDEGFHTVMWCGGHTK